jgi:hypothetical protein
MTVTQALYLALHKGVSLGGVRGRSRPAINQHPPLVVDVLSQAGKTGKTLLANEFEPVARHVPVKG